MSLGSIWSALRVAPALAEGIIAAGDALVDGRGPIVAADLFVRESGMGGEAAGELRSLAAQGVRWLAAVAGTTSRLVGHEPEITALVNQVVARTLDAGLWCASQEAKLKGWLEEA
jgi:hypothetical protein